MFAVCNEKTFVTSFLRSLLITYLASGKKIIVLEKSPEKDLNFVSKNLYEPCIDFRPTDIRVTEEFTNLTYYCQ